MKTLTLYPLFVLFSILINSCSIFNNLKMQDNNKELFKDEINFVNEVLANPNAMDSIIVNSKYYNEDNYILLKHQIKSERYLIYLSNNDKCEPFIQNIWVENECQSRNNVLMEKCIYIFIHFPCREDNPYNIIFVFSKINNKERLINIYGTSVHF